jgi:hypothetical protein
MKWLLHFCLKRYGRVHTAFARGEGFWMHLEAGSRVAFGREYDTALKGLVRIMEPGVENIELGDAVAAAHGKVVRSRRAVENLQQVTAIATA